MFCLNTCMLSSKTLIGNLLRNFTQSYVSKINPINSIYFKTYRVFLTLIVPILSQVVLLSFNKGEAFITLFHYFLLMLPDLLSLFFLTFRFGRMQKLWTNWVEFINHHFGWSLFDVCKVLLFLEGGTLNSCLGLSLMIWRIGVDCLWWYLRLPFAWVESV